MSDRQAGWLCHELRTGDFKENLVRVDRDGANMICVELAAFLEKLSPYETQELFRSVKLGEWRGVWEILAKRGFKYLKSEGFTS